MHTPIGYSSSFRLEKKHTHIIPQAVKSKFPLNIMYLEAWCDTFSSYCKIHIGSNGIYGVRTYSSSPFFLSHRVPDLNLSSPSSRVGLWLTTQTITRYGTSTGTSPVRSSPLLLTHALSHDTISLCGIRGTCTTYTSNSGLAVEDIHE